MHGDCTPVFDTEFALANWNASQLAVADLDGDGKPEIIGVDRSRRVAVFDNLGNIVASSPVPYGFTDGQGELGGLPSPTSTAARRPRSSWARRCCAIRRGPWA